MRGHPTWPWAVKAQPCPKLRPPVGARRLLLQAWLASIEACQLRRAPKPCWLLLLLRLATPTPETRHKGLCAQPSLKESSTFGVTDVLPVSLARQQAICVHQMYRCCKAHLEGRVIAAWPPPPARIIHMLAGEPVNSRSASFLSFASRA